MESAPFGVFPGKRGDIFLPDKETQTVKGVGFQHGHPVDKIILFPLKADGNSFGTEILRVTGGQISPVEPTAFFIAFDGCIGKSQICHQIFTDTFTQMERSEIGNVAEAESMGTPGVIGVDLDTVDDTVAVEVGNKSIALDGGHVFTGNFDFNEPSLAGEKSGLCHGAAVPLPI